MVRASLRPCNICACSPLACGGAFASWGSLFFEAVPKSQDMNQSSCWRMFALMTSTLRQCLHVLISVYVYNLTKSLFSFLSLPFTPYVMAANIVCGCA